MAMSTLPITYNEMTIMTQFQDSFMEHIDNGLFGSSLIKSMKAMHGTHCLPLLVTLCGDGDFYMQSLFGNFQLRSLIRATYNVRSTNYAVDTDFMHKLAERAFWRLDRKQMLKLSTELMYLFPQKFTFLKRWEEQHDNIGAY